MPVLGSGIASSLPSGGSTGDVLIKSGSSTAWATSAPLAQSGQVPAQEPGHPTLAGAGAGTMALAAHADHYHRAEYVTDIPRTFPWTGFDPTARALGGANRGQVMRGFGAGTITKLRIIVGTQSGNICVGIYSNTGTGLSAVPGTLKGTSGSVSCPASGVQDVTLTTSVDVVPGDWFALAADNTTATFSAMGNVTLSNSMNSGFCGYLGTSVPLLTTAGTYAPESKAFLLVGVP